MFHLHSQKIAVYKKFMEFSLFIPSLLKSELHTVWGQRAKTQIYYILYSFLVMTTSELRADCPLTHSAKVTFIVFQKAWSFRPCRDGQTKWPAWSLLNYQRRTLSRSKARNRIHVFYHSGSGTACRKERMDSNSQVR